MANTVTKVSQERLQRCINEAENNGPLSNLSALREAVAIIYNANLPDGLPAINARVVYLMVKEWKIVTKTVAGKFGVSTGGFPAGAVPSPRVSRSDRFANDPVKSKVLNDLTTRYKSTSYLHSLAVRVKEGSMSAAVKLKCLDCCVEDRTSIKTCRVYSCSLWAFRPYQSGVTDDESTVDSTPDTE